MDKCFFIDLKSGFSAIYLQHLRLKFFMKSLLPKKYHFYIFVFSLILLVIGMPLSKFLMSLSQIILICNWLLEGDLKRKTTSFFKNKAALVLTSLFLLHLLGLFYTSDFDYALKDIRIKLPLLVLPLVLSTSEHLTLKIKEAVLQIFILAVITGTIISTLILYDVIHRPMLDIRQASIFISHIRFALLICVAFFSCIYFTKSSAKNEMKLLYSVISLWFLVFLFMMESITGISALGVTILAYILYKIIRLERPVLKYSFLLLLTALVAGGTFAIYSYFTQDIKKDVLNTGSLEKYTSRGNLYHHYTLPNGLTENGHYIWIYYSEKELKEEWNKRSEMDYNWKDLKGNVLRYTLVRYLTSRNLRKDAEGLKQLSDKEIRAIEKGISNVNYLKRSSFKGRLNLIKWEIQTYKETGDANGHSITQRFEAWKAAAGIIKDNFIIGVGTGDVQSAFDNQYEKMNSKLYKSSRLRSHNQYLSITVAFGFLGLLVFLFSLTAPAILLKKHTDFLYMTFFIVAAFSFFTEDTLETQAGVTFYAFLNSFLLFSPKRDE